MLPGSSFEVSSEVRVQSLHDGPHGRYCRDERREIRHGLEGTAGSRQPGLSALVITV